jgi:hypothetical protein
VLGSASKQAPAPFVTFAAPVSRDTQLVIKILLSSALQLLLRQPNSISHKHNQHCCVSCCCAQQLLIRHLGRKYQRRRDEKNEKTHREQHVLPRLDVRHCNHGREEEDAADKGEDDAGGIVDGRGDVAAVAAICFDDSGHAFCDFSLLDRLFLENLGETFGV